MVTKKIEEQCDVISGEYDILKKGRKTSVFFLTLLIMDLPGFLHICAYLYRFGQEPTIKTPTGLTDRRFL